MTDMIWASFIAAGPATIAAVAAWRGLARTKPMGNGWAEEVTGKLGHIEGLLEAHVSDDRAHLTK